MFHPRFLAGVIGVAMLLSPARTLAATAPSGQQVFGKLVRAAAKVKTVRGNGTVQGLTGTVKFLGDCLATPGQSLPNGTQSVQISVRTHLSGTLALPAKSEKVDVNVISIQGGAQKGAWERSKQTKMQWEKAGSDIATISVYFTELCYPLYAHDFLGHVKAKWKNLGAVQVEGSPAWHIRTVNGGGSSLQSALDLYADQKTSALVRYEYTQTQKSSKSPVTLKMSFTYSRFNHPLTITPPPVGEH